MNILHDAHAFIAKLKSLTAGELTIIRRCVTKDRLVEGGIVIEPLITHVNSELLRECYYRVAILFAFHPEYTNEGNMGTTCKILASDSSNSVSPSRQQRFHVLVTSPRENLFTHLFSHVRMAASSGIPVNYARLLCDLFWWDKNDTIQNQWTREFARTNFQVEE
jgi:CRISPR type I-E-associated protein CasB/Cse2